MFWIAAVIICLAAGYKTNAQSLQIVNNTECAIAYRLYASCDSPCGIRFYETGNLGPQQQFQWSDVYAVHWPARYKGSFYWTAFSLDDTYSPKVGICGDAITSSGRTSVPGCGSVLNYDWYADPGTGNITVTIRSVNVPDRYITRVKGPMQMRGGINMIVPAMMEIGSTADTGQQSLPGYNDVRIRTNRQFIVSAETRDLSSGSGTPVLDPRKAFFDKDRNVCSYVPLQENLQLVSLNCYCSIDQSFHVVTPKRRNLPLVFTATEQ